METGIENPKGTAVIIAAVYMAITALMSPPCVAEVSLTVYNSDLAIVKVMDEMSFDKGRQTITFTDVAERIDPTSVRFSAEKEGVGVIEQNYRYDLVNSQKVLQRYIDRDVSIRIRDGGLIEGVLQAASGDLVVRADDGRINIVRLETVERFDLPELPDGLVTRPTLFWEVMSRAAVTTPTEVSYMTSGMSWHAEYTAVVSDDEKQLELSSWVSIDNRSGATFRDATLKLVAGEVHRADQPAPAPRMMKSMMAEDEAMGGFEERGLFEYHLYELQGVTTVANAEVKQLSLFEPVMTKARKRFVFDAVRGSGKVAVNMEFMNSEKDGLGIPLPAGKVRVYTRDTDGALEFVGEDTVGHTPKNEMVRLVLGNAFDIVGERTVKDTRRVTRFITEQDVEISLRNRKDEAVEITAVEHFHGDWDIIRHSADFIRKDATTAEFTVSIPADGELVITYTVRMK